jgi:hypothetical protein
MSLSNPWHIAPFAGCLGLVVYLANGLWSAFVVVDVPHEPGAVVDYVETTTEYEAGRYNSQEWTEAVPVRFSNTLEELKYHHNVSVGQWTSYQYYATLVVGALAGVLAFSVIPRWRRKSDAYRVSDSFVGSAFFGAFAALVVPLVLGWMLPPPVSLLPRQIREAADQRRAEALAMLEQQAATMGSFDRQ